MNEKCVNCCYWRRFEGKAVGECRFDPPIIIASGDWLNEARWPIAAEEDWCGKYKSKKKPRLS